MSPSDVKVEKLRGEWFELLDGGQGSRADLLLVDLSTTDTETFQHVEFS